MSARLLFDSGSRTSYCVSDVELLIGGVLLSQMIVNFGKVAVERRGRWFGSITPIRILGM